MDFNNDWDALLNCGEADEYFAHKLPEKFQVDAPGFSIINAWWLAEFSRLIYKKEDEDSGRSKGPKRRHILEKAGFSESFFFNIGGCRCAIIEPMGAGEEKIAVLVFSGNTEIWDVLADLNIVPFKWPAGGTVHKGFNDVLAKAWPEIDSVLAHMSCPFFYTGHGLGAALATLAASRRAPRALYTFGSPKVGDAEFVKTLAGTSVFRVLNNLDKVASLPPSQEPFYFVHAGKLHYITHNSRIIHEPDLEFLARDHKVIDFSLRSSKGYRRKYDPPQFLADHAPVNYVTHLEKLL